jgi:hypothetical protein
MTQLNWKIIATAFALIFFASKGQAAFPSMCSEVFEGWERSQRAKAAVAERLREMMAEMDAAEAKRVEEAKKQAVIDAEIARQKEEALQAQLNGVTTYHDWNQLPAEARLRVIEWDGALTNLPTKSTSDGRKDVIGGTRLIRIGLIKDPALKAFADKMLDFMKSNSEVTSDRGIYVEVITTLDGQILGGSFYHKADKYNSVHGYFDGLMTPLRYDFSLQYDH